MGLSALKVYPCRKHKSVFSLSLFPPTPHPIFTAFTLKQAIYIHKCIALLCYVNIVYHKISCLKAERMELSSRKVELKLASSLQKKVKACSLQRTGSVKGRVTTKKLIFHEGSLASWIFYLSFSYIIDLTDVCVNFYFFQTFCRFFMS